MKLKPILNVLGALLFLIGVTLLIPILISIYFQQAKNRSEEFCEPTLDKSPAGIFE